MAVRSFLFCSVVVVHEPTRSVKRDFGPFRGGVPRLTVGPFNTQWDVSGQGIQDVPQRHRSLAHRRLSGWSSGAGVGAWSRSGTSVSNLRIREQLWVQVLEHFGTVTNAPEVHWVQADDGVLTAGFLDDLERFRQRIDLV